MQTLIKLVLRTIGVTMIPILCILIPVVALFGSPGENSFWNKKDFSLWSQKECQKLLENSPWSTRYVVSPQVMSPANKGDSFGVNEDRFEPPIVSYSVQLRSAVPMRNALARQMMISREHDNLSYEKKQQMDEEIQDLLSDKPLDKVVFHIKVTTSAISTRNPEFADIELAHYWLTQTTEQLNRSVFLTVDGGEKIPIERFVPGNDFSQLQNEIGQKHDTSLYRKSIEFDFIFPRRIESKAILIHGNKALKLEFLHPLVGIPSKSLDVMSGFNRFSQCAVTFKVDKMEVDGEIAY